MSTAEKENSSLELYETAYKLHYVEGNITEACRIYKVIIDEFPNSNECGYAVIQLQKIQANDIADNLKTGHASKMMLYGMAACIATCVIVMIFAVASSRRNHNQIETLSLVSQALSIMYGGSDIDALEILSRAKTLSEGKMSAPYLLSANIYMNLQQYSRAHAEFDKYQKVSGKTDSVFRKMVTVKIEKSPAPPVKVDSTPPAVAQAPVTEAAPAAASPKPTQAERVAQAPIARPKPKIEKQRPARPSRKPGTTVDSISFF
jgi:tetratricopeptide (TPR) repeat protein